MESLAPPHSLDTERSALAAAFMKQESGVLLVEALEVADFYRHPHRVIFEAMQTLVEQRVPVDYVVLKDVLTQRGLLEEVGGAAELARMTDYGMVGSNVQHYADRLRDLRRRRDLLAACRETIGDIAGGDTDASGMISAAEQRLVAIRDGSVAGPVSFREDFNAYMASIEERIKNRHMLLGRTTGLRELDDATCGLVPGELTTLAAGTGGGKTALALHLGRVNAAQQTAVLYFSYEMRREVLYNRILSNMTGIALFKIRQGWLNDGEMVALGAAMVDLTNMPIRFVDTGAPRIIDVMARCRREKAEHGLGLVILDYTQLLQSGERTGSRSEEIGAVTRVEKRIAMDLNVPVLALSQLSREHIKAKRRPSLEDLRESGSLEQDSDNVWFLYEDQKGRHEVIVGKARNGPTLTVHVEFDKAIGRFSDPADASEAGAPPRAQQERIVYEPQAAS